MVRKRTPYEVLGIRHDAKKDEIKKVYRTLAKKYHPDTNAGNKEAEEKFNEIHNAYLILSDDKKRKELDKELIKKEESFSIPKEKKNKAMNYQNINQQFTDFFGFHPKKK